MKEDYLLLLLTRKLAGEASSAELAVLAQLLEQHADMDSKAGIIMAYWENKTEDDDEGADAFKKIARRLNRKDNNRN